MYSAWLEIPRLLRISLMLAMGLAAVILEAAPLGLAAEARPSPDLVFCVVAYWSVRRPEAAAMLAVFALGLIRDLLTDTPVGIGALSLVVASEYLKALSLALARRRFIAEWVVVALFLAFVLLGQWLLVLLMLAHPPYLSDLWSQWVISVALYPALALVWRWLFQIGWRKIELTAP